MMTKQRGVRQHHRLNNLTRRTRFAALAIAAILGTGPHQVAGLHTARAQSASTRVHIAVVKSLDLPQYNSAYQGFLKTLTATGYEPEATAVTLTGDDATIARTVRQVCQAKPDLILAIGSRAAREVSAIEKNIPIIYSMVLSSPGKTGDESTLPSQSNLTGASLNIPLHVQLEHIKSVFPDTRRVGVISDPARTRDIVDSASAIADAQDVTFRVQWVDKESDVPDAVRALTDSIDVLWMLPDQTVITPRSSRFIIFELIKAGVPIMGLSSAYVKAGAVIALDCDYEDIGRQSGELAIRVLAGQSPATLEATAPRVFTLAVNDKVREHLRLEMDEQIFKQMNVVNY
jgi:putative ABC transport system substrate-binding protein